MKRLVFIISLLLLFSIAETYAKTIVVYRTKINGGANGYANTSRSYESYEDLLVVHVDCWESGSLNCPGMAPMINPPQLNVRNLDDIEPMLADFCNKQLEETDASIDNGVLSSSVMYPVDIVLFDGRLVHYNVVIEWNCDEDKNGTVHLELQEAPDRNLY